MNRRTRHLVRVYVQFDLRGQAIPIFQDIRINRAIDRAYDAARRVQTRRRRSGPRACEWY